MEYVYAAMLLHKAGQKVDEASVKKVLEAAGAKPDDARVKALVASLDGVDIDKAVEKAAMPVAAPVAAEKATVYVNELPPTIEAASSDALRAVANSALV